MQSIKQKTLKEVVTLSDRGLFSGVSVMMRLEPAEEGAGICFVRSDLEGVQIPALVEFALDQPRRTALGREGATVETTEHILSAVAGLGVTNLRIVMDAAEVPAFDGSAQAFVKAMVKTGIIEQTGEIEPLVVTERVEVTQGETRVVAEPVAGGVAEGEGCKFIYELDYRPHPALGHSTAEFEVGVDDYAGEVAPARTFVLDAEAKILQAQGLGQHLTEKTLLVFGEEGPLGGNELRFVDEPARHKLLDLIGDIALAGRPVVGRLHAVKAGHALNRAMAAELQARFS